MKKLQEVMPIARSQMKLRVSIPEGKNYRNKLKELAATIESQNSEGGNLQMVKLIKYADLHIRIFMKYFFKCVFT